MTLKIQRLKETLQATSSSVQRPGNLTSTTTYANVTHTNNPRLDGQPQQTSQRSGNRPHGWQAVRLQQCKSRQSSDKRSAIQAVLADSAVNSVNGHRTHIRLSREREEIIGIRWIWGTLQTSTMDTVAFTIARLCSPIAGKLQIHRKYKTNDNGRIKSWWFLPWGEEEYLSKLEQGWDCVLLQTQWNLEKCFKVVEASSCGAEISESRQLSPPTVIASTSDPSAPTATTSNAFTSDVSPFLAENL